MFNIIWQYILGDFARAPAVLNADLQGTPSRQTTLAVTLSALIISLVISLVISLAANAALAKTAINPPLTLPEPAPLAIACDHPIAAINHSTYIDSTIPADLDVHLSSPPSPTTRIFFTVMVPKHCVGQKFPLIYNQAAWGTHRAKYQAHSDKLRIKAPEAISELFFLRQLPSYGYVVISVDPRGIGESIPENGGGTIRLTDPNAEIQDARQILDWAYDHADEFAIQTEPNSGIAKDLKVGTYGLSYGGGFQMSLAALDQRIDAINPTMTWNDLRYSILPGEVNKLGWDDVLCLSGQLTNQKNTPDLNEVCWVVGSTNPQAARLRTFEEALHFLGIAPGQTPNAKQLARQNALEQAFGTSSFPDQPELINFMEHPGMGYFASQQAAGAPWGFGEAAGQAVLRPVPALFIQGNSDLLFNLTEGYWNWKYFTAAGGDTRILSTNGGHNALITPNTGYCGNINILHASLAWFDRYLKNSYDSGVDSIPKVCISVSDTEGAPEVPNIGVTLTNFPSGSLTGPGAIPAVLPAGSGIVTALQTQPTFIPVTTITAKGAVIAGAPTIDNITVDRYPHANAVTPAVALVATGIRRNGQVFAVDDQVTAFAEGVHTVTDPYIHQEDHVTLPAIGEQLQVGDEVGLVLYPQNYNFTALVSLQTPGDVPLLLEQILGLNLGTNVFNQIANITGYAYVNPYSVEFTNLQLPIFTPGMFSDSQLLPKRPILTQ